MPPPCCPCAGRLRGRSIFPRSDFGYFIGRFDLATFDHTLRGSFLAGLPTGVILFLGFYLFYKPVAFALPRPHRPALLPLCPGSVSVAGARWWIIRLFLLLGIWTHIFWDGFTHDGWFAQHIALLCDTVVPVGTKTFSLPFVLQVTSTLVGFAILARSRFVWWRLIAVPAAFHLAAAGCA